MRETLAETLTEAPPKTVRQRLASAAMDAAQRARPNAQTRPPMLFDTVEGHVLVYHADGLVRTAWFDRPLRQLRLPPD